MRPAVAAAERLALAALLAFVVVGTPLHAQEAVPALPHPETMHAPHPDAAHPTRGEAGHSDTEHVCLNQKERRAETESGELIRLSAAMHAAQRRLPGTVVRARLCRGKDGLVYVLTVLAHDGKVARIAVDAMKGGSTADR
ncbi:MAG TPA: hypothetical protein VHY10_02810 [Xanthobacteraceae bacterium]|nr:hypothetical protein [Xanthobacteraceae bacterium]